jgi:ubiquinone/menaquinone biosynthesis C-methylase UbiE
MSSDRGLHAAVGRDVNANAYDRYIGRWSRLTVPSLMVAAEVGSGDRVLDVATGTGEAAVAAISLVGDAGVVVGADISAAMLGAARARLPPSYRAIVTDGQALAFRDASFDAVVCQLGLMFFRDPARGLVEFRRVLRSGRCAAACVNSTSDRAPMWGPLACALGRQLPDQRNAFQLSFSLGDASKLEQIFVAAGFRDVRVERETRDGIIESFDEYWAAIEAGTGQMPLAYLTLSETQREAVREEVSAALLPFMFKGGLEMSIEMLIGSGRA